MLSAEGAGNSFLHHESPYLIAPPPRQQRSQCKGELKAIDLWQNRCPQEDSVTSTRFDSHPRP